MANRPITTATLTYTVKGVQKSKKVSIPAKRHSLGITKQGHDYVDIGWFKVNPDIGGTGPDNYQHKYVDIPRNASLATLWVGKRAISKAT